MKVLFVSHSTKMSGANKSFFSILKNIKDKVDITVLVNSNKGELIDKLKEENINYIYYNYSWCVIHPRKNIFKKIYRYMTDYLNYIKGYPNKKILKLINDSDFDLIYSNTSVINIGAIISNKLNIPHIWHIREFGEEDFNFKYLMSYKKRKDLLNSSNKIIVISNALKEKYLNIVDSNKIKVIYNGLDIEKYICLNNKHHNLNKINVLVTGQVMEAKGQKQAIDAIYNLYQSGLNVHLFLAGGVVKEYLNSCLSNKIDTEKWLHVLGKIDNVYELRNDMDIELVCSRSEAFGRVTIEAMLHKIPVIGSNKGGTAELLDNNKNGLIYNYNDVEDLKNKILMLLNDKNLYSKVVNNAYEFSKSFTIKKTSESVLKEIKEVLNEEN